MKITNDDSLKKARKDALRSLLELTLQHGEMYHTANGIVVNMKVDIEAYGKVTSLEVPFLMEKYVGEKLVDKRRIRSAHGNSEVVGYRVYDEKVELVGEITRD